MYFAVSGATCFDLMYMGEPMVTHPDAIATGTYLRVARLATAAQHPARARDDILELESRSSLS